MLSLAFAPSTIELGRRTDVDVVLTNSGDGDLFTVRLVARFPPWIRASGSPRRIEIPRIEAGGQVTWSFVLVADRTGDATENLISFPVVTYRDGSGPTKKRPAEVGLQVVTGQERPAGQVHVELEFGDVQVVEQWGPVRVQLTPVDLGGPANVELRFTGAEYAGPDRVTIEGGSALTIEGSLRFGATGGAVPLRLEVTGTTGEGQYVETVIREFVPVAATGTV